MAVDLSDLNPEFAGRMNALIAAAKAQGIDTTIISGARTPEDQRQLQANYQAGQKGQALPYPDRGAVPMAAPVGSSLHEYGLAADIEASDPKQQAALRSMAGQFGLNTIGASDPTHFQMAGDPKQLMRQYAMIGSPNPVSGSPIAPAPQPITASAGTTLNSTPALGGDHAAFITNYAKSIGVDPNLALGIANAEGLKAWSASNPNASSTVDVENGKPFSFGDFQLNVHPGAMGAKAIAAGVNPSDPAQWQAADRFALDQMKAGGAGPWKGDPVAAAYLSSGAVPSANALLAAQNAPVSSTPGRASAGATGSPVSAAATGAIGTPSGPALPGFAPAQSNQFLQGASSLDKAMGGQGLQGQDGGGQDQMRPSPMIGQAPAPHIPNAQAAAQTFGQTLNSVRTPLQWGSGTPGSSISATAGPQVAAGVPQGMTAQELQQIQQLQMMQMMGGGMGTTLSSPYGGGYG